MIKIMPIDNIKSRAFGWVQDPSNMRSLCDVVAIFDKNSPKHKELIKTTIPNLISKKDGQSTLLKALKVCPLKIKYSHLVGTAFTPRSSARCNGIVQATVKGQKRPFIADWPADNFVRWAHALGFIQYNYMDDTFEITQTGLLLTKARATGDALSKEEKECITSAILAYPPAIRILSLLANETAHLTKFEIGKQFGFVGESGFTNLPQSLLIKALANMDTVKERNKMKTDWEGSADKYARMIAKWLITLDLVEQSPKEITVTMAGKTYTETIGQAYIITAKGLKALNKANGNSKHKKIPKRIFFEMLATNASDRNYIRARRAYLIKFLSEHKASLSIDELLIKFSNVDLHETGETIKDDIQGLINIGLDIIKTNDSYSLNDLIEDFIIPVPQQFEKSQLSELKEELREKLQNISHEYLLLLDLAYDGAQNRLFEMNTLDLLTTECNFDGLHLGGSRKPDGIIYTHQSKNNYGVIIDTKAYSKGYNLPIAQADEMERYVRENQTRDIKVNSNEWWKSFSSNVDKFYFMFIAGHFIGNFASQLERVSRNTGVKGTALAVTNLLLCADGIKGGSLKHDEFVSKFQNAELIL